MLRGYAGECATGICLTILGFTLSAAAQTDDGEWPTYGGNLYSSKYAPHDQIDAGNFRPDGRVELANRDPGSVVSHAKVLSRAGGNIGSEHGRHRVYISVVAVALQKKR